MKNKNCCKEKSFVYKVTDNQDSGGNYFSFKTGTNFSVLFGNSTAGYFDKDGFNLFFLPDFHAPPDIGCNPAYLVNGVFRI